MPRVTAMVRPLQVPQQEMHDEHEDGSAAHLAKDVLEGDLGAGLDRRPS